MCINYGHADQWACISFKLQVHLPGWRTEIVVYSFKDFCEWNPTQLRQFKIVIVTVGRGSSPHTHCDGLGGEQGVLPSNILHPKSGCNMLLKVILVFNGTSKYWQNTHIFVCKTLKRVRDFVPHVSAGRAAH